MKNLIKLTVVNDSNESYSIGEYRFPMGKKTTLSVNRHTADNIVITATALHGLKVSVADADEQAAPAGGYVPASEVLELKKAKEQAEAESKTLLAEKSQLASEIESLREQLAEAINVPASEVLELKKAKEQAEAESKTLLAEKSQLASEIESLREQLAEAINVPASEVLELKKAKEQAEAESKTLLAE
ncbi:hypothetical protein, partial [Shewanella algae]|uniref:hypothetical protein n=2 Tax=Shewanella algae TaxID=38313 RepID=UPI001C58B7F4